MVLFGGHARFYSGACVVLFGGHVWFYSGVYLGGMHGFIQGACMVLFRGACMVLFGGACVVLFGGACVVLFGGVHGFIRGEVCMVFSVFFGYNEIRSMSGRYASYWNAFLFVTAIGEKVVAGLCGLVRFIDIQCLLLVIVI